MLISEFFDDAVKEKDGAASYRTLGIGPDPWHVNSQGLAHHGSSTGTGFYSKGMAYGNILNHDPCLGLVLSIINAL